MRRGLSGAATVVATAMMAVAAGGAPDEAGSRLVARCVEVVDGDTLVVDLEGRRFRVDLAGVDAPEAGEPWARQATHYLAAAALGEPVEILVHATDGENLIASVRAKGRSLSLWMAQQGLARATPGPGADDDVTAAADMMRELRWAMWSEPVAEPRG